MKSLDAARLQALRSREIILETLEDRVVLDASIPVEASQVASAQEQALDDASSNSVEPLEAINWYDGQWHYYGDGWWYQRWPNNWDSWYHGQHQWYAQELATGAWFWYDDVENRAWEPCWQWYYDTQWIYNDSIGTWYYTDSNHSFWHDIASDTWLKQSGSSWIAWDRGDTGTQADQIIEYWILHYANEERVSRGLPALVSNANIDWVGEINTDNICNTHVFAHESTAFPAGWQTPAQRYAQVGWTGWGSGGDVGDNLYVRYYQTYGDYNWDGFSDDQLKAQARNVVDAWVYNDAASGWGHRDIILNMSGWNVFYAGVAAQNGVVTMTFSQYNL